MRLAYVVFGCALVIPCALVSFPICAGAVDSPGAVPYAAPVRHFTVSSGPVPLAINEFVPGPARDWNGSGAFSSRDDEWIEVVNLQPTTLDLASYFITDGDTIPRYAFSGSLAPGERVVVFGKQAYDWERSSGHPAFGFSLSNSGDAVMLWQVSGSDTTLIDTYAYKSHEAAADRAIGRLPDASGGWTLFDALNPYTGTVPPQGNGCPPTLDAENACASTPVRDATWGRMKSFYR